MARYTTLAAQPGLPAGSTVDVEAIAHFKARVDGNTLWLPASQLRPLEDDTDATVPDSASGQPASGQPASGLPASGLPAIAMPALRTLTASAALDHPACILLLQGGQLQGEALRVHRNFAPLADELHGWLEELGLRMHVTSSLRRRDAVLSGTIVPPARRSNHLAGHALDMNLVQGGRWFNSRVLHPGKRAEWSPEVAEFIQRIRNHAVLRWGGTFAKADPVHIDDNLSRRAPTLWTSTFTEVHNVPA